MIAQIQVRRGTTAEWAAASPVVLEAGELGYDTTLKRLKVGDGATEWAILEWIDYGTNPNLLHNWDFRNPVNQRAVTGAISTGAEFYDRWIRNSGTVTTNAAYLTISAMGNIEQRIEGNLLAGAIVTVSVMVGGTVYSGTGTFPTSAGTASVTLTDWGTATLGNATGYMYVRLSPTVASNVQAVKLELGTVSTLAYDPPMDYGVELAKCQRYFLQFPAFYPKFYGFAYDASTALFCIPTPCQMRIVPTLNKTTAQLQSHNAVLSNIAVSTVLSNGIELEGTADSPISSTLVGVFMAGVLTLSADL